MDESTVKTLLLDTPEIQEILAIISDLGLSDTWLCAGTIRNGIWQVLSGRSFFDDTTDVDIIFYDPDISYEATQKIELALKMAHPGYAWELKNQAHMHLHNPGTSPYLSAKDAMAHFPETCTAIGARRMSTGEIDLYLPYGLTDILNFVVRPTPYFAENTGKLSIYRERQAQKKWQKKWPQIQLIFEASDILEE